MSEKQAEMWDALAELSGEEVLRVLTDWHGLYLLDDGIYGQLVEEGYIEDKRTKCAIGSCDCDTCIINGKCDRQLAIENNDLDTFCAGFPGCYGCPLYDIPGDCEKEVWPRWREDHK